MPLNLVRALPSVARCNQPRLRVRGLPLSFVMRSVPGTSIRVGLSRARTEFHPHSAHRLHRGGSRRDCWRRRRPVPGRAASWRNLGRGAHASAPCRSCVGAGRHPTCGAGKHASCDPKSARKARSDQRKHRRANPAPVRARSRRRALQRRPKFQQRALLRRQSPRPIKRRQLLRRRCKRRRPRSPIRRRVTLHAASRRTE